LLPAVLPWLPVLFVSAAILGISFMSYQVAAQKGTGALGTTAERSRNFSMLAMGYSVSGFIGPLLAGFAIDRWGFRVAFAVLAMLPVIPAVMLSTGRIRLPRVDPGVAGRFVPGGVQEIFREPVLRRVLTMNVLFAMGWDLHTIFVPIYGAKLGLSASQIGAVLSVFAAATFVVRLAMPMLMRYRTEEQVLVGALVVAGIVYLLYPLAGSALAMTALSFVLGLGLGSGQPMVMSLLHTNSPPGRVGEAVGVRMAMVNASSVVVPLTFGALGSTLGLTPVFIAVGLALSGGAFLARTR
jgi:MFS family permease